jgi:hypothetical protein
VEESPTVACFGKRVTQLQTCQKVLI